MNEICVIAKNSETYFIKRLISEVGDVVICNPWKDPTLPRAYHYLVRTTGVYRDDRDLDLLGRLNKTVINPLPSLKTFREKGTQYDFFQAQGLSFPRTFDVRQTNLEAAANFVDQFEMVIVKPHRGQGGWGVEVLTADEFRSWWGRQQEKGDFDFVVQEYLPDWDEFRVFFVGGSLITLKRHSAGQGAANFAAGGGAIKANLPAGIPAQKIIKASGCVYGAIDFLHKNGEYSILELNTSPGIEQLEAVTGQNIIRLLVTYLKSL